MDALKTKLLVLDATRSGGSILSFTTERNSAWLPMISFCVFLGVTWWSTWYPSAEPGGGGYVAQRMFCAKDERNSLLATLWFSIAHYAIRPWPWILTALASLVLYPTLADKESGFVKVIVDPNVFPPALAGLMIAAFAAAYMSTVATQLNWGASYLVSDFYRRFVSPGRPDAHYVRTAQIVTLLLMVISAVVTYFQDSISGAWQFLMAIGAGTGTVLILRWFWWRINAWSEVAAMVTSFVVSMFLKFGLKWDMDDAHGYAYTMLVTVACSNIVWPIVTLLTQPESKATLLAFYRRVKPSPLLWGAIAREAYDVKPTRDGFVNLRDWIAGCAMVYLTLFGTGKIIFGEVRLGLIFLAGAVCAGVLVYWDLSRRGWKVLDDDKP
ncbi:MAG TPA: sodium:proline symporter, partial [Candidatus Limnocylindria bacterium]|nr:sodium:proline symporter [Candidatus Limnocylindria bacterium]